MSIRHGDLVEIARKWLIAQRCTVVVTEVGSGECPDAIGWCGGRSILVECKASRSDFLRDRQKYFRMTPERGMGKYRYYMAEKGLIKIDELPEHWGLIEINDDGKARAKKKANYQAASERNEIHVLISLLRRIGQRKVENACIKHYVFDAPEIPTLGVMAYPDEEVRESE